MIIDLLPYESGTDTGSGEDINLIEVKLENYKNTPHRFGGRFR